MSQLIPIIMFFGGVSVRRFARASAPAQTVSLSKQSSLASLPAMIEGTEARLDLPPQVTGVVLPLPVSVFRLSTPVWLIMASFFVARLYHIDPSMLQVATITANSVIMSVGGIGLPSDASFFAPITPVFLAVVLPLESIAILFAVATIPDMIETVMNVTADLTATAVVSRYAAVSSPSVLKISPSEGQ